MQGSWLFAEVDTQEEVLINWDELIFLKGNYRERERKEGGVCDDLQEEQQWV